MINLEKLKNYLRIDYSDDDSLLVDFYNVATLFLKGAITNFDNIINKAEYEEKLTILYCVVIQDLYDNRGLRSEKLIDNKIITSLIQQLDLVE